jgi:Kef-type K+ transport system membrane component KefB
MSNTDLAAVIVSLAVIVFSAHLLGHVMVRLRQPRLVGEILAGVVIGPFVLGSFAPDLSEQLLGTEGSTTATVLSFTYWLGLLLLMFISGSEVRRVLGQENRKPTAWILAVGTPLPFFIALAIGTVLPIDRLMGPANDRTSVILVLAIAVAVTSIPVISRIFFDLRILHTRFASIVLGTALLEDIALWTVLAVATALATTTDLGRDLAGSVTEHVSLTLAYMAAGLFLAPAGLRRLNRARWNVIAKASPVGYALIVLLAYAAVAALLEVNLVFAAFLAGFGLVGGRSGSERRTFAEPLDAIQKVAVAVFIPMYFALVGAQLDFGEGFSIGMLLAFLLGSSLLCLSSIALATRLAGFRGLEIVNLAVASNARGGPGIVLASVALEAGIINGAFFTTLVLTAVLTSQFAGWWLGSVLRRGWPLLRDDVDDVVPANGGAGHIGDDGDLGVSRERSEAVSDAADGPAPPNV